MTRPAATEPYSRRLARMRQEIAELEFKAKKCKPEDRMRLNFQIRQRIEGLQMVLKQKD